MYKSKLKYIVIIIVLIALSTLSICIYNVLSTNRDSSITNSKSKFLTIDDAVNIYLENNPLNKIKNGKVFESHLVFGKEKSDNYINVYLWIYYTEYIFNKNLEEGSAGSLPIILVLEKGKNGYITTRCIRMEEGENYNLSIRKQFPTKLQDIFLSGPDISVLASEVLEKAKAYYNIK